MTSRQFLTLARLGHQARDPVAAQRRQPALAQKMQIDGIKEDARLWTLTARSGHELSGGVGTAQNDQSIAAALLRQMARKAAHIRPVQHLDALTLKVRHIRLGRFQIGGGEGDGVAQPLEDAEQIEHPQRAGFAIRGDHVIIDHQHAPFDPTLPGVLQILAPFAKAG